MADITAENYKEDLEGARRRSSSVSSGIKNPKDMAKAVKGMATPMGFLSALKQMDFLRDLPFFCAFGFAVLKDILDIVFVMTGGLIIISMLFSILCSIFIFMMLLLAGSSGKKGAAKGLAKKGFSIIGGGLIDFIPGLGILPAETITVGIVYFMTLSERAEAEKN